MFYLQNITQNGIMKKKKSKWTRFSGRLMSGALAALGFVSCSTSDDDDNRGIICLYGTPTATFHVKGKVTDESRQPLQGKRVILKPMINESDSYDPIYNDTLKTDAEGNYDRTRPFYPIKSLRVVCDDPDGKYEVDSTTVELKYKGGDDAWDRGIAEAEADFTLKEKKETEE